MSKLVDKSKRSRGRPVKHPMSDPIPDAPENVMGALLGAPPGRENDWDYIKCTGR